MSNQHSEELEKSRESSEKLESSVKRAEDELNDYIATSKDMQTEIKEASVLLAAYNQDLEDAKSKLEDAGDFSSRMEVCKNKVDVAKEKISKVSFLLNNILLNIKYQNISP